MEMWRHRWTIYKMSICENHTHNDEHNNKQQWRPTIHAEHVSNQQEHMNITGTQHISYGYESNHWAHTRPENDLPTLLRNAASEQQTCTFWCTTWMLTLWIKTFTFLYVWDKVLQTKWPYWLWYHFEFVTETHVETAIASQNCTFHMRVALLILSLYDWHIAHINIDANPSTESSCRWI